MKRTSGGPSASRPPGGKAAFSQGLLAAEGSNRVEANASARTLGGEAALQPSVLYRREEEGGMAAVAIPPKGIRAWVGESRRSPAEPSRPSGGSLLCALSACSLPV